MNSSLSQAMKTSRFKIIIFCFLLLLTALLVAYVQYAFFPEKTTSGAVPGPLPSILEYTFDKPSPEQNAFDLWTNAIAHYEEPNSFFYGDDIWSALGYFDKHGTEFKEKTANTIEAGCIAPNREARELLLEGVKLGRWHVPDDATLAVDELIHGNSMWDIIGIAETIRFETRFAAWRGDFVKALASLDEATSVAKMMISGDFKDNHYEVGLQIYSSAVEDGLWLATLPGAPVEMAQTVLDRIPAPNEADLRHTLAQSFRETFHRSFIPMVEALQRKDPFYHPATYLTNFDRLFDYEDTVALGQNLYACIVSNSLLPWKRSDREIAKKFPYPLVLKDPRGIPFFDFLEKHDLLPRFLKNRPTHNATREYLGFYPIWKYFHESPQAYNSIINNLEWLSTQHTNILGRQLVAKRAFHASSYDDTHGNALMRFPRVFSQVSLARASLAAHIYKRRHGELPDSLDVLVEEGLLAEVPIDFFSSNPIIYSKRGRFVRSVGTNMEDNGGEIDDLSLYIDKPPTDEFDGI